MTAILAETGRRKTGRRTTTTSTTSEAPHGRYTAVHGPTDSRRRRPRTRGRTILCLSHTELIQVTKHWRILILSEKMVDIWSCKSSPLYESCLTFETVCTLGFTICWYANVYYAVYNWILHDNLHDIHLVYSTIASWYFPVCSFTYSSSRSVHRPLNIRPHRAWTPSIQD